MCDLSRTARIVRRAVVFAKARTEIKRSGLERYSLPSCACKETRKLSGTRELENRSISVRPNSWDILRCVKGLALVSSGAPLAGVNSLMRLARGIVMSLHPRGHHAIR
jgi:hypothetical protein